MSNRHEFMDELKKRLSKLPFDEIKEAVDYYEQYFDEAGEQREQAVIVELGSPANIASQIIADFAIKDSTKASPTKQGLSMVWLVILAVFASPIALPLAIAFTAVLFAVVITIGALVFSIGIAGVCLLVGGLIYVVMSMPIFLQSVPTALLALGMGLVGSGIGLAFLIAAAALSKKFFSELAKHIGRFILRRNVK